MMSDVGLRRCPICRKVTRGRVYGALSKYVAALHLSRKCGGINTGNYLVSPRVSTRQVCPSAFVLGSRRHVLFCPVSGAASDPT